MGRHRLRADPRQPLPPGLYRKGRQFRARHSSREAWVYFGRDYAEAMRAFAAWKAGTNPLRAFDLSWLLDRFVGVVCQSRVEAGTLSPRTARDYLRDATVLKVGLGHIPVAALAAKHIAAFRDVRATLAPRHVHNELALLSAALSWGAEHGHVSGNVCKEVARPPKRVRERLISDTEYLKVYAIAGESVRLAMALIVRTLGLPGDVLTLGLRNVVKYDDGRRTLRFRRGKTRVPVEVEIVGELATVLEPLLATPTLHPTFIRRRDGKPYTVEGIGAMFRRLCDANHANVPDFALRDLRAKGATDMYRADPTGIHQIQRLLGHKSVRTTEIYLKELLAEIVRPNERPIVAEMTK